MNYLLSISYKDFSFKNEMTNLIVNNLNIKSIEYNQNYEWHKTNKKDVYNIECDEIKFILKDGGRLLIQNMNNSLPRIFGGKIDFKTVSIIRDFVELNHFEIVIMGHINDDLDETLQNEEDVEYFKQKKEHIPQYVEIIPNPKYLEGAPGMDMIAKEFISIESLPGHSHQMNYDEKLWFGSCWQMYFSPTYYKYIPKFLFDNFQDCFENKVFASGLRRITLFENPEDFELPENRAKQWAFRRALGIDSIAHELTKQSNRIEPENLPVVITKKNCTKGTTRLELKRAIEVEIKEFLDDGVTLVFEEIKTA
jgi:hypothetical protein